MDHGHATFQPVRTNGTTYVPALGVWADVLPQMVAPDGRAYVSETFLYGRPGAEIISVTDARGTRKLFESNGPDFIVPLGWYAASGDILVIKEGPGPWHHELLDPTTGALHSLPFNLPLVDGFVEPGYGRNNTGIEVWTLTHFVNGRTTILRFDPASGQITEWFNSTDGTGFAQIVGIDSEGSFIIQVAERDIWHTALANRSGIRIQTMLLTSPHHLTVLNHGRAGDPGVAGAFSPLSVTMGNEVWLASDDGAIWLYRTGVGLQQIARVTTSNQGAPSVAISGPCS